MQGFCGGRKGGLHAAMVVLGVGWMAGALYAQAPQSEPRPRLKVSVLVGEGAVHNLRQPQPAEVVLEVMDEAGRAVPGAIVVFQLPPAGPGGVFPGENLFATVTTDEKGRAVVKGLRPNSSPGKWSINVTASYQGLTASLAITQVNEDPAARPTVVSKRGGPGKIIAVVAAAGAATAGGLLAAISRGKGEGGGAGGGGTTPAPVVTTITLRTITVGRP